MRFLPSGSSRTVVCLSSLVLLLAAAGAQAAPHHGDPFVLEQPDGSEVAVRVWGDEFYQRIESLDGFTLIRDPRTYEICYADLAADGQRFVSTGVVVGDAPPAGLRRGLRLPVAARAAAAKLVRDQFAAAEAARLADKDRDPMPSNQGNVLGLTLIIDFSDQPWTIPAEDFDDYLNLEGYTGYGNNGSVRDYFFDVSGGALTYNNWVPSEYLRAPYPKTYYEDPAVQYGQRARQLVLWALNTLNGQGHDFSQYDSNGDGYIDAINVFYAGFPTGGWSVGLWPHSSVINWSADGVSAYRYQITNIGTALRLGTFCHENGHMIMFWPDLYDYGYESSGVGQFCLMCSSGGTNPVRPCAYLRAEAGWVEPVLLEGLQTDLVASHDDMNVFKVPNEGVPNEYYLMETRYRRGRDQGLPDSGLAIWHIDEYGSNNDEQQTPSQHYLVTLVQADGRWDLENGANNGDATDLWKAPNYVEFNPSTAPPAVWWDGRDAPIYIDEISLPSPTMTFNYREGLGTMGVTVEPLPAELNAPWTLEGPNGYLLEGEGYRSLLVWDEGLYTLTWSDVPGWSEPDPVQSSFEMVDGGAPAYFSGTYTDPPFALVAGGAAADPGPAAAVSLVDVDDDGDPDLHVINAGQADRLLRNDGGLVFTDITPAELADTGAGSAAAWGDYDNDGDRDCYLVRDGEANRLLEQDAGAFTDVTGLSYGIDDAGPGADVAWCDVDHDGRLDLYLVQAGAENVVFHNFGDLNGTGHPLLIAQTPTTLDNLGPGQAAVWCDYDLDGDRDVYLVNSWDANLLARSYNGTAFEPSGESAMTDDGPGRDAVWGDFDNDGDWDAYTVNGDREDVCTLWILGYFARQFDPVVMDDGPGRSVAAADFDNDGVLDLYVARDGAADMLLFGDGAGGFSRSLLAVAETGGPAATAACADLDGDGGVDIYVARNGEANLVLRNQIVERGHWLGVDLRGDPANRDAIGARVRLVAGGVSQLREVQAGDGRGETARVLHFGLGAATTADSLVVTWPDGEQTVRLAQAVDRTLVVNQTEDVLAIDDAELPRVTRLQGAYPNPFNPSTTIAFELAAGGPVRLTVYGLDGRRVADLVREDLPAGAHTVTWHGRDAAGRSVASGTYLLRLQATNTVHNTRLTLVK